MTLSGRNGAGKTTLLRMLVGEASIDGGELSFAKGTRVALHDQRPPRELGVSLRDYVLAGAAGLGGVGGGVQFLRGAVGGGGHDAPTPRRHPPAPARAR